MKVKFCGLMRECDIEYANLLLPDFVGFVFYSKSRRHLTDDMAAKLRTKLDSRICPVGVFVNEPIEHIRALLQHGIIDAVQLHGKEDIHYIQELRKFTNKPIIQAFSVQTASDIDNAAASSSDYILLDNDIGGTGKRFDWNLLQKMSRPYFLAGGLTPQNVQQAIEEKHPYAVDISSGVETNGRKDYKKMSLFMSMVRKNF